MASARILHGRLISQVVFLVHFGQIGGRHCVLDNKFNFHHFLIASNHAAPDTCVINKNKMQLLVENTLFT